jgi:hypothetical protein
MARAIPLRHHRDQKGERAMTAIPSLLRSLSDAGYSTVIGEYLDAIEFPRYFVFLAPDNIEGGCMIGRFIKQTVSHRADFAGVGPDVEGLTNEQGHAVMALIRATHGIKD